MTWKEQSYWTSHSDASHAVCHW